MRGRDGARKLNSQSEHFQVFTIDFSEIQFTVNHNSQTYGLNKCKESDKIARRGPYISSHSRGIEEIPKTMVSHLEQVKAKVSLWNFGWFSSCCLYEKSFTPRVKRKGEEPISPEQYKRWHPSWSTSWWDKSEWNWNWAHKIFLKWTFCYSSFRLQSMAIHCDRRVCVYRYTSDVFLMHLAHVFSPQIGSASQCTLRSILMPFMSVRCLSLRVCPSPVSLRRLPLLFITLPALRPAPHLQCQQCRSK